MKRVLTAVVLAIPFAASAQLFSSVFDDASSANDFLVTSVANQYETITFGYDYSARGIAEAPNTPGGAAATRGLFVQTNKPPVGTAGVINGVNITAASGGIAIDFTQDITVTFDMWMGVPSVLTNSTEQSLFGINTDGAGVNSRTGSTQVGADGVWYHLAGEGGYGSTSSTPNSRDYVNYIDNTVVDRKDNGEEPFLSLFPNGPLAGAPGNSWVQVSIQELGGHVLLSMNGTLITDVVNTGPTHGSVFVGYQDPFSSSIGTDDLFVVYDNLNVVPEPATMAVLGLGAAALLRRRRKA